MDDVRGCFLGLPHSTTPAAVTTNKIQVAQRATIAHLRANKSSYCKSMRHDDPRVVANLDPVGFDWQDLCREPPNIATY